MSFRRGFRPLALLAISLLLLGSPFSRAIASTAHRFTFFEPHVGNRPLDEMLKLRGRITSIQPGDRSYEFQLKGMKSAALFLAEGADSKGGLAGFVGAQVEEVSPHFEDTPYVNTRSGYLTLDSVAPESRGSGLYAQLNQQRFQWLLGEKRVPMIHMFTQNPKVFRATETALERARREGLIRSYERVIDEKLPGLYKGKAFAPVEAQRPDAGLPPVFREIDSEAGDSIFFAWKIEY